VHLLPQHILLDYSLLDSITPEQTPLSKTITHQPSSFINAVTDEKARTLHCTITPPTHCGVVHPVMKGVRTRQ
jgi:hypothetical protein